ncbi:MAG: hypothetical protein V4568_18935, partial [Pseudomonadota bacterium]
ACNIFLEKMLHLDFAPALNKRALELNNQRVVASNQNQGSGASGPASNTGKNNRKKGGKKGGRK